MLKELERDGQKSETPKMRTNKEYYQIYVQIYETSDIVVSQIADNMGMAEDAVVKLMEEMYGNHVLFPPYLAMNPASNEMYGNHVLFPPYLAMNPASNYTEYLHFLEFGDINPVLPRLERHPFVISYMQCEGAWNILVFAFQLMYFNDLAEDFCIPLYQGKRGITVTPKCAVAGAFEITGERCEKMNVPEQTIDWDEKGWLLYNVFGENMRKAVQPVLKENNISYEEYVTWRRDVDRYCSAHTLYYPLGFYNYVHRFFLMETDAGISSLFEEWPCSSIFIEVNHFVLAHISVPAHEEKRFQTLSQYLDNVGIPGFCAAPLYGLQKDARLQSKTHSCPRGSRKSKEVIQ